LFYSSNFNSVGSSDLGFLGAFLGFIFFSLSSNSSRETVCGSPLLMRLSTLSNFFNFFLLALSQSSAFFLSSSCLGVVFLAGICRVVVSLLISSSSLCII